MGKKHKKHKTEWRSSYEDYTDKPLEKPLKLVLKVGGSEVTELSGSGHDSSYYDDRSDHERERHKEKKKKKKKKSEKEKHLDDEERRKRKLQEICLKLLALALAALTLPHRKRRSGNGKRSMATRRERLTTLILGRRWMWSHPLIGPCARAGRSQLRTRARLFSNC